MSKLVRANSSAAGPRVLLAGEDLGMRLTVVIVEASRVPHDPFVQLSLSQTQTNMH